MDEKSWRKNHGRQIIEEHSWNSNHVGAIAAGGGGKSWMSHHGGAILQGAIMKEQSWSSNHGRAILEEQSWRRSRGGEKSCRRGRGGDLEAQATIESSGSIGAAHETTAPKVHCHNPYTRSCLGNI